MTKLYKFLLLLVIAGSISANARAQILISLLFGDALNSDNVEFGLIGGLNRSYAYDLSGSEGLNNFNLGFYFHIKLLEHSYLSTGVLVKSNVGASGLPSYPIGDPDFDQVFSDAELTKKIHYFYVPVMFHKRFNQRWYIEGGVQMGLRNKANDSFILEANGGDLQFEIDARDDYKRFDGGLIAGAGYKWKQQIKSISTGVNYYYGLANVSKVEGVKIKNSSIYIYVKVPIGAGGKNKKDGVVD